MNKIKWGCIQPLTGGMYIGTRNVTNTDADWIINYKGHRDYKEKDGEILSAGNEYNLAKWLEKQGANVPVYSFTHGMFEDVEQPAFVDVNNNNCVLPDGIFDNVDIVTAVPVCSGLSNATIASDETKAARNCNMVYITKYALSVVKPKIYIFENAPTLMGDRGKDIRTDLENMALKYGYSVAYLKTDTLLHHNCQKRPRTFVMFIKWRGEQESAPDMTYEAVTIDAKEYIDSIPADATQQIAFDMTPFNTMLLRFIKHKFGDNWRKNSALWMFHDVMENNWFEEFKQYISDVCADIPEADKTKAYNQIDHIVYKLSIGKSFYSNFIGRYNDHIGSIQFKTIQSAIHHNEERLLTIREALWLMGMPHDFEMCGEKNSSGPKIGQNVPVKTAEWVVGNAVRIINNWDSIERETNGPNSSFFNNLKQQKIW